MSILSWFLEKKGIKDVKVLSPEEQETLKGWESILSKGETTVDGIKEFCENQVKVIEVQWRNLDNDPKKNERLVFLHTVYSTLLSLITAPVAEKESLERYLRKLVE